MGYGDDIMATGEVKNLKKKFPRHKFFIGDGKNFFKSEIFNGNNSILQKKNISEDIKIKWIKNYPGYRPYRKYNNLDHKKKYTWDYSFKATAGEIFFNDQEILFSKNIINKIKENTSKKLIHIEPNVKLKKGYQNRDWGFNKWQQVVDELSKDFQFIQTSFGDQKKLKNVINIHNVNFKSACSIISLTNLFVGTEGGFHHAAAALGIKAVVIFGGFIDPKITGYEFQQNLYIDSEDSPCGAKSYCKHCKECMNIISVQKVKNEILKII